MRFFDESLTLEKFIQRIILVHPLQSNSIMNLLYQLNKDDLIAFDYDTNTYDLVKTTTNAIMKDDTILSNNAVIGSHLDFNAHQYSSSFIDRPHVHWWWNGLFQANSGGDWEHSYVAFFEPLVCMEKIMGCAPYDTMTMGPHKFTENSCLLVPDNCVEGLKSRLIKYNGKILGFNPDKEMLRTAINRVLQEHYPNAFNLVGKTGIDINQTAISGGNKDFNYALAEELDYNCSNGYFNQVSLQSNGSKPIPLMKGENELLFPEYKRYAKQRFVGLHSHSPTDIEHNKLMNVLKQVSCDFKKANKFKMHFIAFGENLSELCIVESLKIYEKLIKYSQNTGMHGYANYLIKKALIVDLATVDSSINGDVHLQKIQDLLESKYQELLKWLLVTLTNGNTLPNPLDLKEYKANIVKDYRVFLTTVIESMHNFKTNDLLTESDVVFFKNGVQ